MTLPNPFPFYGDITTGGSPTSGAKVYVKDLDNDEGTVNATTDASGKYILDISSVVTNGNTVHVWCLGSGKYKDTSFTLDISGAATKVDLALETTTATEIMGLNDLDITKNVLKLVVEQIAMDESRILGTSLHFTDSIGLLPSYIKGLSMHYIEQLALLDNATAGGIKVTLVTEQLALLDSYNYNMKKVITEQIALNSDGYIGLNTSVTDKIGLKETITYFPSIVITAMIGLLTSYTTGNVVSIVESLGLLETTLKTADILITDKIEMVDDATAGNRTTVIEQIALIGAVNFSTSILVTGLIALLESSEKTPGISKTDIIGLSETTIKGTEKVITDIIGLLDNATTDTGIGAYPTETLGLVDNVTNIDYLINVFEKMGLLSSHLKNISLTIEDKIEILQAYNTLAHIVGEYIQSYYASEHKDSGHVEEHKDSDESEVMK